MDPADLKNVVPFQTGDGSMTLYDRQRDIHYRSWHGARSEARHVFLGSTGLLERHGEWRVGELGFGAAVNFVETVQAFRQTDHARRLVYHSVDWRPVTSEHLAFHDGAAGQLARRAVSQFHRHRQRRVVVVSDDEAIELHLHAICWEDVELEGLGAHAFYHDPFSKRVNPQAWSAHSFVRARAAMDSRGRLATYSAATSVKRAMFEAGFFVATASGPGRKREMTVASPSREALESFELLDRQRYIGES